MKVIIISLIIFVALFTSSMGGRHNNQPAMRMGMQPIMRSNHPYHMMCPEMKDMPMMKMCDEKMMCDADMPCPAKHICCRHPCGNNQCMMPKMVMPMMNMCPEMKNGMQTCKMNDEAMMSMMCDHDKPCMYPHVCCKAACGGNMCMMSMMPNMMPMMMLPKM